MKIAYTIAASDSSAGAGVQADLATFSKFGIHGCSVITKITAQNTKEISSSFTIPAGIFKEQLVTLYNDLKAQAIKISVLGDIEQVKILSEFLLYYQGHTIYDPVLVSSSGTTLTDKNLLANIKNSLIPYLTLITPNIPEAEVLTGVKILNQSDIIKASKTLLDMGVKNVLLKGGHGHGNLASDFFINNNEQFYLTSTKVSHNTHGTGCHLASCITANLALGHNIADSIIIAKRYINSAIRNSYKPVPKSPQHYIPNYNFEYDSSDMPILACSSINSNMPFLECGDLGLYVIVDTSNWVQKLCEYGVKTVQLRIKDANSPTLEEEIIKSIAIAKKYNIKLFINDYTDLAIKHGAYGVHLGQEDLDMANVDAIKNSGMRLGISSHSHYELCRAIGYKPSYIALGPIYPTTTKIMPWKPQGLKKIQEWQQMITCPLVVIGGINLENIDEVIRAGARNIALVSAITKASNPENTTKQLLSKLVI